MSEPETYNFHLIFKGLFRCVPSSDKKKLDVLLVDARSPKANSVGDAYRDHRPVIEFHLDDWRNSTTENLKNFVEVNKQNKKPVGIYLLNEHDILLDVTKGQLSPELKFVETGENSYLMLPRMEEIAQDFAEVNGEALGDDATGCVARVSLDRGRVTSERLSRRLDGTPQLWKFLRSRTKKNIDHLTDPNTNSPEKDELKKELEEKGSREINLDLKVTFQIPVGACVLIDARPFPNNGFAIDPPAFILRPDPGQDLKVWIKNRELHAILTESDEEGDEESCLDAEFIDFDWELHFNLSAKKHEPQDTRIPYKVDMLKEGDVTAGGCACGGCI